MNTKIIYENYMLCTYLPTFNLYDVWVFDIYLFFIIAFLVFVSYIILFESIQSISIFYIYTKDNTLKKCQYYIFRKQWLSYIFILEFNSRKKNKFSKDTINHIDRKLGSCFDNLKHYKTAIKYYSRYLKEQTEDIFILEKLGYIYQKQKYDKQALLIYQKLIEIDPSNKQAIKYLEL